MKKKEKGTNEVSVAQGNQSVTPVINQFVKVGNLQLWGLHKYARVFS